MKKRSLKSLRLNKKSISHLEMENSKGGHITISIQIRVSRLVCPSPMDIATKLLDCN